VSWLNNSFSYANGAPIDLSNPFGMPVSEQPSTWDLFANGLNNTVSGIGESIGQGLYDLYNGIGYLTGIGTESFYSWGNSRENYADIYDRMYSVQTPEVPEATPYVVGALGVSAAAATAAGGAIAWEAAGLPTMSIGYAPTPFSSTPHFFWSVSTRAGTTTLHTLGRSTTIGAETWASYLGGSSSVTGIPILFPGAAAAAGIPSYNCLTGAAGAVRRGIFWF
jgi:hypothetical protein